MPAIVTPGDRLVLRGGSLTNIPRPSLPFNLFFNGHGNVGVAGGTMSYQDIYEQQVWVYIAVNKLSRQISRLPLKVYRHTGNGERERVRPSEHPLARLLMSPAPRRSPVWLKQKTAMPALIQGNATFLKVVANGPGSEVEQLIPLDWRFMQPELTADGRIYAWKTDLEGFPKYLDPSAVLHFAWDTGAGDVGVSPLKALARTIRLEDSAQRYQASSFENGVRHSALYTLPDGVDLDDRDKEEMRKSIQATQGGVDKSFGIALAYGGGTITPLSHTAVEAELIDQRKLDREEVAAAYDIPPPLIGILDHATYSNVAEMHRMLYGMVLGPWLTMIEETIQAQLIDSFEPWAAEQLFVEFDLAEVLKGDTLSEIQAIAAGIGTGILNPNEGRAVRNMPRSDQPGMDDFYLPTNNLKPVGTEEPEPPAAFDRVPPPPEAPKAAAVNRHIERAAEVVRKKQHLDLDRLRASIAADTGDPDLAQFWVGRIEQADGADAIRALRDA